MVRYFLLGLASVFCAIASLTAVKAPTLPAWKGAILVSEFGYWFLIVPLLIAALAWRRLREGGAKITTYLTVLLAALSLGFLLKPLYQAFQYSNDLPEQLAARFGRTEWSEPAFSFKRLLKANSVSAGSMPETHTITGSDTAPALAFDFYRPSARGSQTRTPLVVVVHGGGWDGGNRKQFEAFSGMLASWGYAVAAVEYRLAPANRWPAQQDDVRRAIEYLRAEAARFGIDSDKVVLFGRSAGGHIAEAVAFETDASWLRGLIAFYAPADLNFAWKHTYEADLLDSKRLMRQLVGGTPDEMQTQFDAASPYLAVRARKLPTLLAHGRLDALVWHRQSERLAERLQEVGTPVYFLDLPWATHGFDFNSKGPAGQLSAFSVKWFLERVTQ